MIVPVRRPRIHVRGEVLAVPCLIPELCRDRRRPDVEQRELLWMLSQLLAIVRG